MQWITSEKPVEYETAIAKMERRVADIRSGLAQEAVWLLEHPPLYTAGTSAKDSDLLNPRFPVYETGRGGEYTYHGPGQRVAYVMLNLKKRYKQPDIKHYVWSLEEWIIQALAEFGIAGQRVEGRVGIWVNNKKIAAIGVRVRHWISYHGIAINVSPDLSHFNGIVPCGISDAGVTSFEELGIKENMTVIDRVLKEKFESVFNPPLSI